MLLLGPWRVPVPPKPSGASPPVSYAEASKLLEATLAADIERGLPWLAGAVAPASPGAAVPVPLPVKLDDVASLIEEYRRVGVELLPAKTSDPDGSLVPLPAKPAPERVVPPLPFTAYQAMLRG